MFSPITDPLRKRGQRPVLSGDDVLTDQPNQSAREPNQAQADEQSDSASEGDTTSPWRTGWELD